MNAAILSLKEVKFWSLLLERRDYSLLAFSLAAPFLSGFEFGPENPTLLK
jgi:hypothetical protein